MASVRSTNTDTGAATLVDAVAQVAAVHTGSVSAAELVEIAIGRLEAVNDRINAVALPNYARARALAAAGRSGPLAGVPTLIKDNIEQGGLPWTSGCRGLRTRMGGVDSPLISAIEGAGAISIGRSTLPEFSLLPVSESLLTGPTRNPWNLAHSPGGSSGGSAAAVAAGVVAVAHANDGGGSIRIPASNCNLVGLKPSRARMSGEQAARAVTDFGVNGCVSRTVRDTAAWFAACEASGDDALYPPVGLVTGPAERRLKIHVMSASGGVEPHADVAAVFETARKLLGKLGHAVADGRPSYDAAAVGAAFQTLWSVGAIDRMKLAADFLGRPVTDADVEPLSLTWAAHGAAYGQAEIDGAIAAMTLLEAQYAAQFDAFDVLMTPTLGLPPVAIGTLAPTQSYAECGPVLNAYVAYTPVENGSGAPAISLPIGFSSDGLPIGMQFSTRPGGERVLLELAYELERETGWDRLRPPLWVGAA